MIRNEALLKVAKQQAIHDGTVTLTILPFRPIWMDVASSTLQASEGDDETNNRFQFCRMDSLLLDATITDEAPPQWIVARDFFANRTEDTIKNWEAFKQVGTIELLNDFAEAFAEVMTNGLSAPAHIQAGVTKDKNDPEA
jgi:hypothetical protein